MYTERFAILALMTLHGALPAAAANIRDHIEKVRIEAPVVYVGHVDAVETLGRTKFDVQARATVRVARMFRGAAQATRAQLRYSSWDDSTPPLTGGPQYQLRQGSLVLAFASSLDATMPPGSLVHGEPGYLVDMVNGWKQSLFWMNLGQWAIDELPASERPLAETLREGVTEENRKSQLRLYDEVLAFLHEQTCAAGDPLGCMGSALLGGQDAGASRAATLMARAAELAREACDGGRTLTGPDGPYSGCSLLGSLHREGMGVPKDEARAAGLLEKACSGGDLSGCFLLGLMYKSGAGVSRDIGRAAALFERACGAPGKHTRESGCFALADVGQMYLTGTGVAKDLARAAALRKRACDGGWQAACEGDRK